MTGSGQKYTFEDSLSFIKVIGIMIPLNGLPSL